jgi:hypothetical protein
MRSIIARTSTLSRTCLLRPASNVSVPTSSILGYRSVSTTSTSASTSTAKTPLRSHSTTAISPASTAHCTLFPPTHSSTSIFKPLDIFAPRHIGPREKDVDAMLSFLGYNSMEEFVSQTVPGNIRIKELDDKDIRPLSELEFMRRAERLAAENKMVKSYIGMGYHNAIVPPVIQRNVSASGERTRIGSIEMDLSADPTCGTLLVALREPGLVHRLHSLQSRTISGTSRIPPQLPDGHNLPLRSTHRQRFPVGRIHRSGRGHDHVPGNLFEVGRPERSG